ncbi:MAG: rRNA maturation RNase YbeY [Oscillospiraceae bacterium]|nr:rRNA maturation RNase YbeY [Oscillospiraceae bacterium]
MSNKVFISNRQNTVKIPSGIRLLIRRCCNAVLKYENFEYPAEISVSFVDNAEIKLLNTEHRNKPVETDVLSFPMFEKGTWKPDEETGAVVLGDIVISVEKAVEQANLFGHTLQREIAFLTVHSMLHLLGYDHELGGIEEVHMREKEELVLKQLGLPRGLSYVAEEDYNA